MKKVLFVTHSNAMSGGANRSLLSLMTKLREYGDVESLVLTPGGTGGLKSECEKLNIPVFSCSYKNCCTVYQHEAKDILRFAKIMLAPITDFFSVLRAEKHLPTDIDIIYSNEKMILAGAYLAYLRKKPHIWHVRSFDRENKTVYAPFYDKIMDRLSDRVVLISGALMKKYSAMFSTDKLYLVHNGIESVQYETEKTVHEGFNMLLTGRLVAAKAQLEAVEALHILKEKYGKTDAVLYLAGETPKYEGNKYIGRLRAAIKAYDLEKSVVFLGEVSDMRKVRTFIDTELVCSGCEAFGRVTVEAMCAHIPVIGARSGGTVDIITDGETGFFYEQGNPADLAEKINYCMENGEELAKVSEAAYMRALNMFTMDNTAKKVHRIISEI